MASSFQKKTSRIFLTVFIGFIAISFMFTGYENSMGTPDTVARVGDIQISVRDYQNEYNRQLEFYRQMMGSDLTSQQIESFGLRQSAVQSLIQRSLMVQFARELGVHPGADAIRDEIRSLPYFQTGGRFDMNLYRQLLAANSLTPSEFESMIENQLQSEMASNLMANLPISKSYLREREEFRSQKTSVHMVEVERSRVRNSLTVSDTQIEEFLNDEVQMGQVRELFNNRKPQLDRPEEVLASHILLRESADFPTQEEARAKAEELVERANANNFAQLAEEFSQDPSAAGQGGSLGWFGRGQMVPEFEDVAFSHNPGSIVGPIESQFGLHIIYVQDRRDAQEAVFEDYKETFAKELIRSRMDNELNETMSKLRSEIHQALSENDLNKVQQLQAEYNLKMETDKVFNRLEGARDTSIFLRPRDIQRVFHVAKNIQDDNNIIVVDDNNKFLLVRVNHEIQSDSTTDLNLEQDLAGLRGVLGQRLNESVLEAMQDKVRVRVWENRVF